MKFNSALKNFVLVLFSTLLISACSTAKKASVDTVDDVYTGTDTVEYLANGVPDRVFFATNKSSLTTRSRDTLRKQASLRAIELLTSYALANILKDKDRLAVRDIERAEKLTAQFGFLKSPTKVIAQYLVIRKELEESIRKDLGVASTIGIMPDQIYGYEKIMDLSKQKELNELKGFRKNLAIAIDNDANLNEVSSDLFGNVPIVGDK